MLFLGCRDFSIFFLVSRFVWPPLYRMSGPKNTHGLIPGRRRFWCRATDESQYQKKISIPNGDLGHLDTTKKDISNSQKAPSKKHLLLKSLLRTLLRAACCCMTLLVGTLLLQRTSQSLKRFVHFLGPPFAKSMALFPPCPSFLRDGETTVNIKFAILRGVKITVNGEIVLW